MATISNTPRPGYAWDATDNCWYPIGTGPHTHGDYITSSSAINPTIVDAKGDIITATAADTPARLAVGNNGDTLVADSSTATGLRYKEDYAAGKNKIINGDFAINQRGFTSNTTNLSYNFDRWTQINGGTSGTLTVTPQTFTPGAAPVAGYEGANFVQCITASGADTNTFAIFAQRIEDVRTYAGQTVTVSFWAKATSGTPKIAIEFEQNFGSGGSPSSAVTAITGGAVTLSTSFARYSVNVSVSSISGKTIGTTANTSFLQLGLWLSAGSTFNTRASSIGLQNATFQIWGVQVEESSVATAFQTATGTIQGELAACQRYYQSPLPCYLMQGTNSTRINCNVFFPVAMRTAPTVTLSTASPYWESLPYQTVGSLTSASVATSLITTGGGILTINGTFGTTPVQSYPGLLGSGQITYSSEL
jgi:hypothetical protein